MGGAGTFNTVTTLLDAQVASLMDELVAASDGDDSDETAVVRLHEGSRL